MLPQIYFRHKSEEKVFQVRTNADKLNCFRLMFYCENRELTFVRIK